MTRAGFRLGEHLAPGAAAAVATRMWFTLPPGPRTDPLPGGGTDFEVDVLGGTVRGTWWGAGPVVYLVHGWGGSAAQFAHLVGPLVERGLRVVVLDAPSHGRSDPGPGGPRTTHGVEFARALEAVAARFGPAHAVVAHSFGAIPVALSLTRGWLTADRLVLLAPMARFSTQFDLFQASLRIGPRTRRRVDRRVERRVGIPPRDFDLRRLSLRHDAIPTLLVHDLADRQTWHAESVELARELPAARLVTTEGLGHRRLLADPAVVGAVADFLDGDRARTERRPLAEHA